MPEDAVLAVDVGTTGVNSVVYSSGGKRLASDYSEFPVYYPKPGWVEQDAEDWWTTTVSTVRECCRLIGRGHRVIAMSVTNQRETVVPVDREGKPLTRAMVWQDRRSSLQASGIKDRLGPGSIFEITGLNPDPYFTLPKILWWKKNQPRVFKNTWKFMLVHDFLMYRLTGEVLTDHTNASRTMLLDLGKREWSSDIADEFGLSLDKMPNPVLPGSPVAPLEPDIGRKLGIPGTPLVVAGGGDQQCSALGLGITGPGKVKSTTGTGTFIVAPVTDRDPRARGKIVYSAHAVPDTDIAEASIFTTGSLLAWIKRLLYHGEDYETLNREAQSSGAGARGLYTVPFFSGAGAPHWSPESRGMIHGLTLGHVRGDIARSVMEAVAFEIRTNLDVMLGLGIPVKELVLDGGAARSRLWNQIICNVVNKPCLVAGDVEATAAGAAVLAAVGAGLYPGVEEAVSSFASPGGTITPEKPDFQEYLRLYHGYDKLRQRALERD